MKRLRIPLSVIVLAAAVACKAGPSPIVSLGFFVAEAHAFGKVSAVGSVQTGAPPPPEDGGPVTTVVGSGTVAPDGESLFGLQGSAPFSKVIVSVLSPGGDVADGFIEINLPSPQLEITVAARFAGASVSRFGLRFQIVNEAGVVGEVTTIVASVVGVVTPQPLLLGEIERISPPRDVRVNALESDAAARIFIESTDRIVQSPVAVNLRDPGVYTTTPTSRFTIATGTHVASYYVHADQIGNSSTTSRAYIGSTTFGAEILGVIVLGPELQASHAAFGVSGTQYGPGDRLEFVTDSVAISADRRTLTFTLFPANGADNLRILTAAVVPN